jgi:putative transposase
VSESASYRSRRCGRWCAAIATRSSPPRPADARVSGHAIRAAAAGCSRCAGIIDTFELAGRRLRLSTAKGTAPLSLRLAREVPYPPDQVRSVTLLTDAGRIVVDVTAAVPVKVAEVDPDWVAGVDLGIIHPYAVVAGDQALLVSGRAIRADERLHLADTKARARHIGRKAPRRGQRGSRRWRKLSAAQRRAEARHRRRVRQAHHEAAKAVIAWAVEQRVGTLVVGDPQGIAQRDSGRRQNWRLHVWRRAHLMRALIDKAEAIGITIVRVDERGTSSTCPACHQRVPKPKGRQFSCPHCGQRGHRDLIAARNIADRHVGGTTNTPAFVTHRRAGTPPARRDRRRHQMDQRRRSCPAPGRPPPREESLEPHTFEDHTTTKVA